MQVTRFSLFAMLLLSWSSSAKADSQAVVFGSFVNRDFAESRRLELERITDVPVSIASAQINGVTYHRILVYRDNKKSSMELLELSRQVGIEDAWILDVSGFPVSVKADVVEELAGLNNQQSLLSPM